MRTLCPGRRRGVRSGLRPDSSLQARLLQACQGVRAGVHSQVRACLRSRVRPLRSVRALCPRVRTLRPGLRPRLPGGLVQVRQDEFFRAEEACLFRSLYFTERQQHRTGVEMRWWRVWSGDEANLVLLGEQFLVLSGDQGGCRRKSIVSFDSLIKDRNVRYA